MLRHPPRSTRTDTLCPCTTLCRSGLAAALEAEAAVHVAVRGERGGQDRPALDHLALAPGLLDHHGEAVARGDVGVEVDVVLEDIVGDAADVVARQPQLARRVEQRAADLAADHRSEEHTSELQSLMRNSYAVFCLKKKSLTSTSTDTTLHPSTA